MSGQLVTKAFVQQAIALPDKVKAELAKVETVEQAKGLVDKVAVMQSYAKQIKATIEIERPIAYACLLAKAKLGELMPREKGGRGKKLPQQVREFSENTIAAFRKLGDASDKIDDYYEAYSDDVPTQKGFIDWIGKGGLQGRHTGEMEWYTPEKYIDAARATLGEIDLDPASNDNAQKIVRASAYYTQEDSGLEHEWAGNVFLNPPYKMPLVEQFVFKLCDHVEAGDVKSAILLTNNCTDPKWWQRAARVASAVCFTAGRISFYNLAGEHSSPTNGQTFCYFGKAQKRFEKHFSKIGVIL